MESMTYMYLTGSSKLMYSAMNVSLISKSIVTFYMPYLKVGSFAYAGYYYFSDVTSFLFKMRSFLPSKETLLSYYNQQYLGTIGQLKLFFTLRRCLAGVGAAKLMNPSNQNFSTKINKVSISIEDLRNAEVRESEPTSENQLQMTTLSESPKVEFNRSFEELRALRREFTKDITSSSISGAEKAGQKYLDLIFRDQRVHRGSLYLINNAIREKSFIKDSRDFGILLINEVIKDETFRKEIKDISLQIIRTEEIKQTSIDIIKHVVTHPTTRSYVIKLMVDVLTNTQAKDVM